MKHIFQLPAILLPITIILVEIIIRNTAANMHIHDAYVALPLGFYLAPEHAVVLITYVLHLVLKSKQLISSKWAWLQVITTVLPFICYTYIALSLPTPISNKPHFTLPAFFSGIPASVILLLWSLLTAIIAQLLFWIYAIRVLSKPRYFKSA
jgi:hypothetical protein